MALRNTHGQVLPDLRMNVVDPTVARLRAIEPVKQRLRQEGALKQPDFSKLSELVSEDMYYRDRVEDVAALNQIQEDYLKAGLVDPLRMFGPEARSVLNQVRRFKNNPRRQERVQAYQRGLDQLEQARKNQTLNDVWVSPDGVQFVPDANGQPKPLRVGQAFEYYNNVIGADPNSPEFSVNQESADTALKWLADYFSKAKTTTRGGEQPTSNSDVLAQIRQTNNIGQIQSLLSTLVSESGEGQEFLKQGNRNINAIFAQAVGELENSGLGREDLLAAANQRAVNIIKSVATGETTTSETVTTKSAPGLDALYKRSNLKTVDAGRSLSRWFHMNDRVIIQSDDQKFNSPGSKQQALSTIVDYGFPNNNTPSTQYRDPGLGKNYLLNNTGFISNFRIARKSQPGDPDEVGLGPMITFPNDVSGAEQKADFVRNSIIDPDRKVQYFFTVMDSEGNFVTDGPVANYGRELTIANQEFLQGTNPNSEAFAEAINNLQIQLNQQLGSGSEYRLQATMQVPAIYAMGDIDILGINFWDRDTGNEDLVEEFGEKVDGSQVMRYFRGTDIEESLNLNDTDDFYRFSLIAPVTHSTREWAYADIDGGQPTFKPQIDRSFSGAGLQLLDVVDPYTAPSGISTNELDETLGQ